MKARLQAAMLLSTGQTLLSNYISEIAIVLYVVYTNPKTYLPIIFNNSLHFFKPYHQILAIISFLLTTYLFYDCCAS